MLPLAATCYRMLAEMLLSSIPLVKDGNGPMRPWTVVGIIDADAVAGREQMLL